MIDNIQARRGLQIALGIVWLLDAALQFQPFMFGRGFATQIIEPAAAGEPGLVARPLLWSAHLMAAHPVACNAAFAVVQLAIAAGLLLPRTVRPALAVSVAWALGVWWLGEGLGGTLTGEHGVGVLKRRWLPMELGADVLDLHGLIKQALDPQGLLNPGKGF